MTIPLQGFSAVEQSHSDLVAKIAAASMRPIRLAPAPEELTQAGLAATLILSAVKEHLTAMVREAERHDPGNSIRDAELVDAIDAHLSDLASDIAGAFSKAADRISYDRYGGVSMRGPFYRNRVRS